MDVTLMIAHLLHNISFCLVLIYSEVPKKKEKKLGNTNIAIYYYLSKFDSVT